MTINIQLATEPQTAKAFLLSRKERGYTEEMSADLMKAVA